MLNSASPETRDTGISRISSLNGYTPHNNKLLTHPFCYILLSNGQGQDAILKQELWNLDTNNEMVARMEGCLTPGCSIRMTPINYNGDDHASMYGITLGKFPQISWSTDPYVNWLTENGINTVVNMVGGLARLSGGDITGGVQAFNSARAMDLASQVPPQVKGNTNAGDVMYATNENCFHVYRMTIKQEIARVIDNYFTRFGYKVNTIKIPEFNSRTYWNFIKIVDGEEIGYGEIPSKAMDTINRFFRNGVSVWHSHANLGNFSLANW